MGKKHQKRSNKVFLLIKEVILLTKIQKNIGQFFLGLFTWNHPLGKEKLKTLVTSSEFFDQFTQYKGPIYFYCGPWLEVE